MDKIHSSQQNPALHVVLAFTCLIDALLGLNANNNNYKMFSKEVSFNMRNFLQITLFSSLSVLALAGMPAVYAEDLSPLAAAAAKLGVNERAPDGSTPLQWAVYEGDVERVKSLLSEGADIAVANNYGSNAMQLAAEVANTEILELLLDAGANADSPNPEGQTALMLVARTGNVEAAKLLISHDATVDARETWGQQTALMWASARRHPEMMELLLTEGADVDAQSLHRDYKRHVTAEGRAKSMDTGGLTPLMYAVRENCLSCLEVLIKHEVDLDKPDPDGMSPLVLAIHNGHWDISKRLIEAGADVDQWDKFGRAALFTAIGGRKENTVMANDPLNQTDGATIVRMLLEAGANPNMQLYLRPAKARGGPLSRGTTPLIVAASGGDLDMIRLLLEHGARADLLQADRQGPVSALMTARGPEDTIDEALRLLVSAGADVNALASPHHLQRTRGGTPLHYAVRSGKTKALATLVELGADLNAKDIDGLTALDHAMSRNQVAFLQMRQPPNQKVADALRALGANVELDVTPYWPNVGPPFYYPWSVFPLDPAVEATALIPGSIDHQ
ncbi:MAG: ankyrin repeat domain-containing protein [Pseudomonadota bacterium]